MSASDVCCLLVRLISVILARIELIQDCIPSKIDVALIRFPVVEPNKTSLAQAVRPMTSLEGKKLLCKLVARMGLLTARVSYCFFAVRIKSLAPLDGWSIVDHTCPLSRRHSMIMITSTSGSMEHVKLPLRRKTLTEITQADCTIAWIEP